MLEKAARFVSPFMFLELRRAKNHLYRRIKYSFYILQSPKKAKKKKNLYVVWKFDHLSTHTNMDMYVFVRDWTVLMIYLLSLGTTLDIGNRSYLLLQLFTLKKQVFSCIAIVIFIIMFQILWKHGKNVTIKLYIYIFIPVLWK